MIESVLVAVSFTSTKKFTAKVSTVNFSQYGEYLRKKIALCPHNAVYGLAWCASDSANRERFWHFFRVAVIAFGTRLVHHQQEPYRIKNQDVAPS